MDEARLIFGLLLELIPEHDLTGSLTGRGHVVVDIARIGVNGFSIAFAGEPHQARLFLVLRLSGESIENELVIGPVETVHDQHFTRIRFNNRHPADRQAEFGN